MTIWSHPRSSNCALKEAIRECNSNAKYGETGKTVTSASRKFALPTPSTIFVRYSRRRGWKGVYSGFRWRSEQFVLGFVFRQPRDYKPGADHRQDTASQSYLGAQ